MAKADQVSIASPDAVTMRVWDGFIHILYHYKEEKEKDASLGQFLAFALLFCFLTKHRYYITFMSQNKTT